MSELPIISCDDCGACCMEQMSPPGYIAMLPGSVGWDDPEDNERFRNLPAEARTELDRYVERLRAGLVEPDGPCIWLDLTTKRCRWYEHRPTICRELNVGSEGCRGWRDEYNVDVYELMGEE